jgi:hypothetical protein
LSCGSCGDCVAVAVDFLPVRTSQIAILKLVDWGVMCRWLTVAPRDQSVRGYLLTPKMPTERSGKE